VLLERGSAFEGFGFLGHRLQIVNGQVQTTVAPKATLSLNTGLARLDQKFSELTWLQKPGQQKKAEALRVLAEMVTMLKGWRAAFREADDVDRHTDWCETLIAQGAAGLGFSPDQVATAIDGSMQYHPTDYVLAG
jgi:hypothetical protein